MAKKIVSKRVSNYELFYDLIFVLAMSRMTSYLHTGHFHLGYLAAFIVSNSLVMSIWTYQTIYLNKYGERGPLRCLSQYSFHVYCRQFCPYAGNEILQFE